MPLTQASKPATPKVDEDDTSKAAKTLLWISMIGGIGIAGVCFVYKIAEFIFTLNESSVQGFADVPVSIYFTVAAGWLCLLVWCFLTGKFNNIEESKLELLELEEAYELRGE